MKFNDKRFLSPHSDEGGSVRWFIDTERYFDNELIMTDSYKTITLDFSYRDNKELQGRIEKVDTLIQSLTLMKEALIKCKP